MATGQAMPVDYIFFIYGLAFLYVGAVCLSMRQGVPELVPWRLLGLFGVSHGFHEWLDLLALEIGDSSAFVLARLALMTLSYVALFEFGRLGAERLGLWVLPRWVVVPVVLAVGLTVVANNSATANGLCRLFLALPACLLAMGTLIQRARSAGRAEQPWLLATAMGFLAYGLTAGVVGPTSAFPLAHLINHGPSHPTVPGRLRRIYRHGFVGLRPRAHRIERPHAAFTLAFLANLGQLGRGGDGGQPIHRLDGAALRRRYARSHVG
jgi:hypothetical protein